jgi:hypothetical protein
VRLLQGQNIFRSIFPDWQKTQIEQIEQAFSKANISIILPNG